MKGKLTGTVTGSMEIPPHLFEYELPMLLFKDSGSMVVYCPPLDLSGYGKTIKEAEASFDTTLEIYLKETMDDNTLEEDLKSLGWNFIDNNPKPPELTKLASSNRNLKKILNKGTYTQKRKTIELPIGWQRQSGTSA